jgi:L-serine dehydratase
MIATARCCCKRIYYSIGGGFVVSDTELEAHEDRSKRSRPTRPFPIPSAHAQEMLEMAKKSGLSIAQMKRANEEVHMSGEELDAGLDRIWSAMSGCIDRGLAGEGIMPGGLKVRRRARVLHEQAAGGMAAEPAQSVARQ